MTPLAFKLNPTLLSTSTYSNNVAAYQKVGNGLTHLGQAYGLPLEGTFAYTVQGGGIYPGIQTDLNIFYHSLNYTLLSHWDDRRLGSGKMRA